MATSKFGLDEAILCIEATIRGIDLAFADWKSDTALALEELWASFPHPWKMADVLLRWSTSLAGRLITAPYAGLGEVLIARLSHFGFTNRVMRVDDAIRLMLAGPLSVFRLATFTDQTGILGVFGVWIGRTLYRGFKRSRLLFKLLQILIGNLTEAEFLAKLVSGLKTRALLFFWVAVILYILCVLATAGVIFSLLFVPVGFWTGAAQKLILPQDSKRVWRKRGGMGRVNVRRGPDTTPNDRDGL